MAFDEATLILLFLESELAVLAMRAGAPKAALSIWAVASEANRGPNIKTK